jgi:hypothetical protein
MVHKDRCFNVEAERIGIHCGEILKHFGKGGKVLLGENIENATLRLVVGRRRLCRF